MAKISQSEKENSLLSEEQLEAALFAQYEQLLSVSGIDTHASKLVVGYSGGLDSTVLLHTLAKWRKARIDAKPNNPEMLAIHVNHNVSKYSAEWVAHCQTQAEAIGVEIKVCDVEISNSNIEAEAREKRYRCFDRYLDVKAILLTAHHLDDQVETFFLRLMRGAGTLGLSAISAFASRKESFIARPLLSYSRQQLEVYAEQQQLSWLDDESNEDTRFSRNYIRHQINPRLEYHWPNYRTSVEQSIKHMSQAQQMTRDLATMDMDKAAVELPSESFAPARIFSSLLLAYLDINTVNQLADYRRINLLRELFLRFTQGFVPGEDGLTEILELLQEKISGKYILLAGLCFYIFQHKLWLISADKFSDCLTFENTETEFLLSQDKGQVINLSVDGLNISAIRETGGSQNTIDKLGLASGRYRLVNATALKQGQRILLSGHRKTLKNIFQELGLPPFLKSIYPVVLFEDEIVSVGNYVIADSYRSNNGYQLVCSYVV